MHCPDGISGSEYIELIAAVAIAISQKLDVKETFWVAEFLQAVSYQLFTLAAFKEAERARKKKKP
ncbi:hypothetical protein CCDG5_2069 [[Clostridium] cellulosi]|jgi:hypothetical protein|uniref:Uncharacterized protein n=1 Tax=[Clostridium] cellulosi TaxID=29343 RepID=A0A078KVG5_9FIRM|nr:MAG: hypothetical protein DIU81_00495 [[Clostridium] cellulosi]CDZ25149.1 hypothetical protein CCDG5_2069 [[Clostridium] cellulosi]